MRSQLKKKKENFNKDRNNKKSWTDSRAGNWNFWKIYSLALLSEMDMTKENINWTYINRHNPMSMSGLIIRPGSWLSLNYTYFWSQ